MKIENQVCTLEQSKTLKKMLGEVYGLFVYMENKALPSDSRIMLSTQTESFKQMGKIEGGAWIKYYPAFTTAELGLIMPVWHFTYPRTKGYTSYKNEGAEFVVADGTANGQNYDTEAECRAALIIYLLENNSLTIEACNKRLLG